MRDPPIKIMSRRNWANSRGMKKRGISFCWTICRNIDKKKNGIPNHFLMRTITLVNVHDILSKQLTGTMERIFLRVRSPVFILH